MADGATDSPTQTQLGMGAGRFVDEYGKRDKWDRGGVYIDGEYQLEATKDLLADRLAPVKARVPETAGDYEQIEPAFGPKIVFKTDAIEDDVHGQSVTSRTVEIFPRGPHLHNWTVSIEDEHPSEAHTKNRAFTTWFHPDAIGLDTPRAAVATAYAVMLEHIDAR